MKSKNLHKKLGKSKNLEVFPIKLNLNLVLDDLLITNKRNKKHDKREKIGSLLKLLLISVLVGILISFIEIIFSQLRSLHGDYKYESNF